MAKLTVDTITDEQIRELRDSLLVSEANAETYNCCQRALGHFNNSRVHADEISERIDAARACCAEIINARAKGKS